ncbi:hypothetical protein IFM46972_10517 [Aspergillus udagawae]|uniref:Uncharacterized protein n=1 Tax=Aspergillus udagawae TaxID=91492 RepID=A0A8H3SD01_9EURO|nr:hypothetical protein IFM46972_10517 [Aspergillus udagawae]
MAVRDSLRRRLPVNNEFLRSREAEKLAVRYRKFKLPALLDAAVNVTGLNDAQCVKVLKCVEGQYNKALVLTMSTGQELVARLPNPNAGPAFYTTASEVATRQFGYLFPVFMLGQRKSQMQ